MHSSRRTPLFALHQSLGARMTEFGGFAMPLSYEGIIAEHLAVRSAVGLFDLSHMGELYVEGRGALALLERALTNSAARLRVGRAQYTLLCAEDGGTIDDLIVYRLGEAHYMLCVNAANCATDHDWLRDLNPGGAELRDLSEETALVAVQGPSAAAVLVAAAPRFAAGALARFGVATGEVAGVECAVARTGYTGEDGFELFAPGARGARLYQALLETGGALGAKPCGLGARDTLRLEAGLSLYGHELDRSTSPLEAGLDGFVRFGRGFVGETALWQELSTGSRRRLVGLRTCDGRTLARQGYALCRDGRRVGAVTSGTFAPSFNRPLAMGYLDREAADTGGALEVEVRGRWVAAETVALPFYRQGARPAA